MGRPSARQQVNGAEQSVKSSRLTLISARRTCNPIMQRDRAPRLNHAIVRFLPGATSSEILGQPAVIISHSAPAIPSCPAPPEGIFFFRSSVDLLILPVAARSDLYQLMRESS